MKEPSTSTPAAVADEVARDLAADGEAGGGEQQATSKRKALARYAVKSTTRPKIAPLLTPEVPRLPR